MRLHNYKDLQLSSGGFFNAKLSWWVFRRAFSRFNTSNLPSVFRIFMVAKNKQLT